MKKWIIVIIIVLLMIFSSCATHEAPTSLSVTSSENDYNFFRSEGIRYMNQKNYGKAVVQFNKALVVKQDSSKVHNLLGIAYFQQQEYKKAEEQFKKALKITPSYAKAYNNLGSAYFMLRELDKAKKMFKKALSLSPELVSAHFSLGTLLVAQGKTDEGFSCLSKGIELDPGYLDKDEHLITNFSSTTFGTSEIYFAYAKCYAAVGNIEKTVEYLRKAEKAGFRDWYKIGQEKQFEEIKEDQKIKDFIKL